MEISFETRQLRDLCEDEVLAEASLSKRDAELLRIRLSDIRAAENYDDLQLSQPAKGVYDEFPSLIYELTPQHALVIVPQGKGVRRGASESSWLTIRRVKVVSLENINVN
ncbi:MULTISPECIES: hypothetical protein [unclassified Pseudoxanthomonas]|uniref:hypothetical protein n=1 Tax=unclassified Pseudoxanthomonas TaxID=2645906 RepID=UPI00307E3637